jgi:hypothetical protein
MKDLIGDKDSWNLEDLIIFTKFYYPIILTNLKSNCKSKAKNNHSYSLEKNLNIKTTKTTKIFQTGKKIVYPYLRLLKLNA